MKNIRSAVFASTTVLFLLFWMILPGSSQAQGIGDGLSQLLGGLGGSRNSGQSGQPPSAPISVDRNTHPYTGVFSGKETTGSETKSLDAKFACFPAHDPSFEQTDAFICYAAQ